METQKKQIVLIVDDSLLICEQIKAALKDTPIFICEAHNGQEAVDMVRCSAAGCGWLQSV